MSGTLATLASFAREPARRRIAVLGSMAELGDDAAGMHARVGAAAAAAGIDALLVGGAHAADLALGARDAGYDKERIVPFADNDDAVAWLRDNARAGDLVLAQRRRAGTSSRRSSRDCGACMPAEATLVPATAGRSAPGRKRAPFANVFVAIPVRTRLVREGDDLAADRRARPCGASRGRATSSQFPKRPSRSRRAARSLPKRSCRAGWPTRSRVERERSRP